MHRFTALGVMSLWLVTTGPANPTLEGTTSAGDKAVGDAVVWLDAPDVVSTARRPQAVLDQRNLSFSPHVLAVQLGTKVEFPNHDRVFHNVFSYRDGRRFNLGLYPVGTVKEVPFDQPGLSRVFCNIHPQMAAYVMVVDTPYFAVSDKAGRFSIPELRPGTYRYHAWRPGADIMTGSALLRAGELLAIKWPSD